MVSGHMTQARKKAEETMEYTDMVIEVLDARVPAASQNPITTAHREAETDQGTQG